MSKRLPGDFDDRLAILIAQLFKGFTSRAHLCWDVRRCLAPRPRFLVEATKPPASGYLHASCAFPIQQ